MQVRRGTYDHWAVLPAFAVALFSGLFGCASQTSDMAPSGAASHEPFQTEAVSAPVSPMELSSLDGGTTMNDGEPGATIVRGVGSFISSTKAIAAASWTENGDVTLNFVDADIREVLKAVLGDALVLNYSVDPAVQGHMTLQTSTPITREAVLPTLEAALRLNGIALLENKGLYTVTPLSEARRRAGPPRIAGHNEHGYGLEVVQLKYVSVQDMQQILNAVAPEGGIAYVDAARNLVLLSGTEQEIDTLVETISLFDVNFLKSMSFGVFTPRNVTVEDLTHELMQVIESGGSPLAGLLTLVPIPRINALLVIAKEPDLLDDVQLWVKRLDVQGVGPLHRKIYLYRAQNAKAVDLADTLSRLYGAATSTGAVNSGTEFQQSFSGDRPTSSTAYGAMDTGRGLRDRSVSPSMGDLAPADRGSLDFSKDGLRVVADGRNNLLIILATQQEYSDIEAALQEIDIAPDQVLIEATIAEVTLTDELKFGVQWLFSTDRSRITFTDDLAGKVISKFPGFAYAYFVQDTQVALNALSSITDVNVISAPKIMVLDNRTATLQVGDEVPIATQSAVSVIDPEAPIVNTIQFRQTGVILDVTPRVNKSGLVIMDVSQEVSDVAPTTTSTLNSPTIQQRKFTSTVAVQSGTTVALGGLIRDSVSKGRDGVPWLKDIPGIGAVFRSSNNKARRTELLVFMTPHIVRNRDEAREITEYLRERLTEANLVFEEGTR